MIPNPFNENNEMHSSLQVLIELVKHINKAVSVAKINKKS